MKRKGFFRFWRIFLGFSIFMIVSFSTALSQAQVQAQHSQTACEEIQKVQQLLSCILQNHPELHDYI